MSVRRPALGPVRVRRDGRIEIRLLRAQRQHLAAAAAIMSGVIAREGAGEVPLHGEESDVDVMLESVLAGGRAGNHWQEDLSLLAATALGPTNPRLSPEQAERWVRALTTVAGYGDTVGNDVAAVALLVREGLVEVLV